MGSIFCFVLLVMAFADVCPSCPDHRHHKSSMHDMRPECPQLVYYKMSPRFGNACYYVCILDLLSIAGGYYYAKNKMDGSFVRLLLRSG